MKKASTKTSNKVKDSDKKSDKTNGKKTITKKHSTGTDEYGSGLDPKRGDYRSKE
jgi:hypothetical protein